MISKNDICLLLTDMQLNGIDTKDDITRVMKSTSIPLDVLKRINDNRALDVSNFYNKIRQSYNSKKSKLYINIMRSDENIISDPKTVLTTLSAMLNQILQFNAEDKAMFYEHSRCEEIIKTLDIYFKTFDINPAFKLLTLMKADIKVLEMIK